jgi:hypothetical protein
MSERFDEQQQTAEALDDLVMSKGVVLDDARLDWLVEWVERIVAERLAIIPAQREAFLDSPSLDPAWIAGWHAAIDHATYMSTRPTPSGGDPA